MANHQISGGSGSELRRIVRISEEIKGIVATAFKINLMAMNAIFLAKRAGQSALGFAVLSNELRRFAADLQQQMAELREATYGSVATVTTQVKQARITRLLERARSEAQVDGQALLRELLCSRDASILAFGEGQMAALNRHLAQMIGDTTRLVETGGLLVRSAKIEAAYGGEFSASLMQVSSDFEKSINDIKISLEGLTKHQAEDLLA